MLVGQRPPEHSSVDRAPPAHRDAPRRPAGCFCPCIRPPFRPAAGPLLEPAHPAILRLLLAARHHLHDPGAAGGGGGGCCHGWAAGAGGGCRCHGRSRCALSSRPACLPATLHLPCLPACLPASNPARSPACLPSLCPHRRHAPQDRLKIVKGGIGPDTMLARQVVLNCGAFHGWVGAGAGAAAAAAAASPAALLAPLLLLLLCVCVCPHAWVVATPCGPDKPTAMPSVPLCCAALHAARWTRRCRYGEGCNGGDVIDVVRYMKSYGLPDESCQVGARGAAAARPPPAQHRAASSAWREAGSHPPGAAPHAALPPAHLLLGVRSPQPRLGCHPPPQPA